MHDICAMEQNKHASSSHLQQQKSRENYVKLKAQAANFIIGFVLFWILDIQICKN